MTDPVSAEKRSSRHYLGDGLYASNDYGMAVLSTDRGGVIHWVALEPAVLAEFERWVQAQRKQGALP